MLRPPPTSTLFPYTTLFRSMSAHQLHRMLGTSYEAAWFLFHRLREAANDIGGSGPIGGEGKVVEADEADRKSTRLNSSHRCISYAVFCLKKKKKNTMLFTIN